MSSMGAMSMDYNYYTINGKSYPATVPVTAKQGQLIRLRIVNPSQTLHPMHLHGLDMAVVAKDGETLAQPQRLNTLDVAPGDTYDVVILATTPGTWLFHCHDLHHVTNNGVEPGGLIVPIVITASDQPAASPSASATPSGSPDGGSASPSAPGHTAAPGMTAMPGMSG
ncbi:MAG: multicopper oxidase domain-containing protein, partial [Candidatus Limnocylindrales bacterium]